MMALELGQEVHGKYLTLAKQVMKFEKALVSKWLANIDADALSYLKLNILTRDAESQRIVVNFSKGLGQLMRETRYLDRMGFDIPEIALNVTLQEERYIKCAPAALRWRGRGAMGGAGLTRCGMQASGGAAAHARALLRRAEQRAEHGAGAAEQPDEGAGGEPGPWLPRPQLELPRHLGVRPAVPQGHHRVPHARGAGAQEQARHRAARRLHQRSRAPARRRRPRGAHAAGAWLLLPPGPS